MCVVSDIASFYFYAIGFGIFQTIWHYSVFIDNMGKQSIEGIYKIKIPEHQFERFVGLHPSCCQ